MGGGGGGRGQNKYHVVSRTNSEQHDYIKQMK